MPHPALAALRSRNQLLDLLDREPGLITAMAETMVPVLDPDTIPELWRPLLDPIRDPNFDDRHVAAATQPLIDETRRRVRDAVPYWVEASNAEIVVAAAESRPHEPINRVGVPALHGWVHFDGPSGGVPVHFVDLDGVMEAVVLTGMLWTTNPTLTGRYALWVTFFSNPSSTADVLGALLRSHSDTVDPFPGLGALVPVWSGALPMVTVTDSSPTPHGPGAEQPTATERSPEVWEDHWAHQVAGTFFALLGHAFTTSTWEASPKDSKRLARLAPPGPPPGNTVSVITLHRDKPTPREDQATGTGRKWGVRTIVGAQTGGFWRRVTMRDGSKEWRFILPYVAGPEGAPLVIRKKVYAWRR